MFDRANDIPQHLLQGLTASQARAVRHKDGPALVLAGPGSGKTRVITKRIAALIAQGVRPYRILAVTFTNKAAAEMRHRVANTMGEGEQRGLTVCTFHSLCVRLLRRYAAASGLVEQGYIKPEFTIMDSDDQSKLIKKAVEQAQLSSQNFPPRTVLGEISTCKNALIDHEVYAARARDFRERQIAKAFKNYQYLLRQAGSVDFDDLLLLTVRMLATSDAVRRDVQDHYRYTLVDEYQDTNSAQFLIAALIAGDHVLPSIDRFAGGLAGVRSRGVAVDKLAAPNIVVVGDPDQSIYGWRGADIGNILNFEKLFPGVTVIPLGENFRSRASIISVADRLIQLNKQRKHKPLIATRAGGDSIEVVRCRDEHHEAKLVADWARRVVEQSRAGGEYTGGARHINPEPSARTTRRIEWKDIAVFYRTNALSRVVEDAFRRAGVPYHLVRGTAFFQREEVKNAVAYLRLIANPGDSVSLERIINTPSRGISDKTFDAIEGASFARGSSLATVLDEVASGRLVLGELSGRAVNAIGKFLAVLQGWRGMLGGLRTSTGEEPTLRDLVEAVVTQSGLKDHYSDEEERLGNLAELINSASEFEQQLASGTQADPDVQMAEALASSAREQRSDGPMPESHPEPKPPKQVTPAAPMSAGQAEASQARGASPSVSVKYDLFGDIIEQVEPGEHAQAPSDLGPTGPVPADFDHPLGDDADGQDSPFAGETGDGFTSQPVPAEPPATGLLASLRRYLEHIALIADSDGLHSDAGAVQLMTLHAAKGLEFPAVALIGLEHGVLPHFRATEALASADQMEEERRLFFVGITRAMDKLLITTARFRSARGFSERTIPSQFLEEIKGAGVNFSDQSDPFGAAEDDEDMHAFLGDASGDSGDGDQSERPSAPAPRPVVRPAIRTNPGATPGSSSAGGFTTGDRVRHPQFGEGKIIAIMAGAAARVTVQFKAAGTKTLVLDYARLTRI